MTAVLNRPPEENLWASMPGWGIVADLTPPELTAARQIRVLRKAIAAALALVTVLCAIGYGYAYLQKSSAVDAVDAANARTTQLVIEQGKYSYVTQLRSATQSINAEVASLTSQDVDVAALLAKIRGALPGTMALTSVTITISGTAAGTDTAASLDRSGRPMIGTVTLAGSAGRMTDVAEYVTRLSSLPGVANVVPSSNTSNEAGGSQWNATLQLTDTLYTHRYNATTSGGDH